jgi:hypothetical protein
VRAQGSIAPDEETRAPVNTDELWLLKLAAEKPPGAAYVVSGDHAAVERARGAAQLLERRGLVTFKANRPNGRRAGAHSSVNVEITDKGRKVLESCGVVPMGNGLYSNAHLTRIPKRYEWAAWIDQQPLLRFVLGSRGTMVLPFLGTIVLAFLHFNEAGASRVFWVTVGFAVLTCAAGLVATGAKQHSKAEAGASAVRGLQEFLNWMHSEVFSGDTNIRITVMVLAGGNAGSELRVFLRPENFPSTSTTRLRIYSDRGNNEGVAGLSFRKGANAKHPQSPTAADAYKYELPPDKADQLARKAAFYFAHVIPNPVDGPNLGVLIVDNLLQPRIRDDASDEECALDEHVVRVLALWVGRQLSSIPKHVRELASCPLPPN